MVSVTLQIQTYCDQVPVDRQLRTFEKFPVIIGRRFESCDYYLPDESKYVSNTHARIDREDNTIYIQDTSANGVYYNGSTVPVGHDRKQPLSSSDTVTIGDYTLSIEVATDPFADPDLDGPDVAESIEPQVYKPFHNDEPDWTPPSKASSGHLADDWPPETDNEPMVETGQSEAGSASHQGDPHNWANWVEEDNTSAAKQPVVAESLRPGASTPSLPDDLDWLPGNMDGAKSFPPLMPEPTEPRPRPPVAPAPYGDGHEMRHDHDIAGSPSADSPAQRSAPQAESGRPKSAPAGSAGTDTHQALAMLLAAAGVNPNDLAGNNDDAVLEQAGKVLAVTIDAMMVLLQSRAELKDAIRADVTSLAHDNNNPLKFSYSAADALNKLLAQPDSGFMDANQAVNEAVDDLKLHQVAMIEGMKAAVKSMLLQFNPYRLSKKLEKSGGISANIPITREAKLWELFCEQYDSIHEEAMSDFGELFGSEFRKAYEKRIRRKGRMPDF